MKTNALTKAIADSERDYMNALDRLRDLDSGNEACVEATKLREAIELVRCLRRLVAGRTGDEIYKAFGAPGDFGYETPIGEALAEFYRGG